MGDPTPSLLIDVLSDFASHLKREEGLSAATIAQYRADCTRLAEWLRQDRPDVTRWEDVTTRDLRAYMTHNEPEPARNRRLLSSWRKLWGYLKHVEGLNMHPGPADMKRVKLPGRQPKYLTPGEVTRLLDGVQARSEEQVRRNRAIIGFLYGTGCRIGEVLNLKYADIEFDAYDTPQKIRVIGKGNKERSIYLSPTAQRVLENWLKVWKLYRPQDSTYLFCHFSGLSKGKPLTARTVELVVKRAGERAGLPPDRCTPHKLRHSHATALVKAGRRLEEVQEILGHESISTTRIYAHLEPERLKAAADSLPDI